MKLLQRLIDKIHELKEKSDNKKDFSKSLIMAVRDGVLTEAEIQQLDALKAEYCLTDNDLKSMKISAYEAAYAAAKSDGVITEAEEQELGKIQTYLGITESEISKTKSELSRLRLINEIQKGNLPTQFVNNLVTQRGETVHWSETGKILEERVVSRRYVGFSSGFSFKIAKGVSYRIGASRGHLVSDTAIIPVSVGNLILSNKRVIFAGDQKSFALKLDKILNIDFFRDGVRLHAAMGKPRIIQIDQPAHVDIIGAIISSTVNGYA